ncbi:MAG: transcription elongation factor GreA [Patescibacteria group bacterium]
MEPDKHYLTAGRLEELKKELINLKTTKRLEIADRLSRAKELGDLSENSEYVEAREEQSIVESKIFELEEIVRNAVLIKKDEGGKTVRVGSTAVVKKDGKESRFSIVGSNESNPESGFISNESPLGKAFLNKKAGDVVNINTPRGEVTYKIISVE